MARGTKGVLVRDTLPFPFQGQPLPPQSLQSWSRGHPVLCRVLPAYLGNESQAVTQMELCLSVVFTLCSSSSGQLTVFQYNHRTLVALISSWLVSPGFLFFDPVKFLLFLLDAL